MTQLKRASLFNALAREFNLWRQLHNHTRYKAFTHLLKYAHCSELLDSLYAFFNIDNCEVNNSNIEQKAALLNGIMDILSDGVLPFELYNILAQYSSQLDSSEAVLILDEISVELTKIKLRLQLQPILDKLDDDTFKITTKLEDNGIIYFTDWINKQVHNINSLCTTILTGKINVKTNKFCLNKMAMSELRENYLEDVEESRVLYSVGINIIDFDLFTRALSNILKVLYDETTVDYIDVFMYDYDCCNYSVMNIEWEEGGFSISDTDSLVEYLEKYVYAEVL